VKRLRSIRQRLAIAQAVLQPVVVALHISIPLAATILVAVLLREVPRGVLAS